MKKSSNLIEISLKFLDRRRGINKIAEIGKK
jgi:hypothetical protein